MEVDKEVLDELVNNLEDWLRSFDVRMREIIDRIRRAESVEEVMRLKKKLLLEFLDLIPLNSQHCYFCILHADDCIECEYGSFHGSCYEADSDYRRILDEITVLKFIINGTYYKGERYD